MQFDRRVWIPIGAAAAVLFYAVFGMNITPAKFGEFVMKITLAKLVYSGILVALVITLVGELCRLWVDTTAHLGKVELLEAGVPNEAAGKSFAALVVSNQRRLIKRLNDESDKRKASAGKEGAAKAGKDGTEMEKESAEGAWWGKEIPISESKLEGLKIDFQGVDVTAILTKLREWVSPSNQVLMSVEKTTTGARGTMAWDKNPAEGVEADVKLFTVRLMPDTDGVAMKMAAYLTWARSAKGNKDLEHVSARSFADWAYAWMIYADMQEKIEGGGTLGDTDRATAQALYTAVSTALQQDDRYPELLRLRADLVSLFPEDKRTPAIVALEQQDRIEYRIRKDPKYNDPANPDFVGEAKKHDAKAQARPVILVKDGKPMDPKGDWGAKITDTDEKITHAIRATGYVAFEQQERAVCVAVGPNLVATVARFLPKDLLEAAGDGKSAVKLATKNLKAKVSFGEEMTSYAALVAAGGALEVIALEALIPNGSGERLAILRVSKHDTAKNMPLTLGLDQELAPSRAVFLIGYPRRSDAFKLPRQLLDRLFNEDTGGAAPAPVAPAENSPGRKALQPGMLVTVKSGGLESDLFPFDGLDGAPLVDLATGVLVGLHTSGEWAAKDGGRLKAIDVRTATSSIGRPYLRGQLAREQTGFTSVGEGTLQNALKIIVSVRGKAKLSIVEPENEAVKAILGTNIPKCELGIMDVAGLLDSLREWLGQQDDLNIDFTYKHIEDPNTYEITIPHP